MHLIMAMDFVAFRISTKISEIECLLVNQRIKFHFINNSEIIDKKIHSIWNMRASIMDKLALY